MNCCTPWFVVELLLILNFKATRLRWYSRICILCWPNIPQVCEISGGIYILSCPILELRTRKLEGICFRICIWLWLNIPQVYEISRGIYILSCYNLEPQTKTLAGICLMFPKQKLSSLILPFIHWHTIHKFIYDCTKIWRRCTAQRFDKVVPHNNLSRLDYITICWGWIA